MTYSTLRIWKYPEPLTDDKLDQAALDLKLFVALDAQARNCGPFKLADCARRKGHPIHGPDNCWIRVRVSQVQLMEFLAEMVDGATLAKAPPPGAYLIESEEY